MSTRVQVSLQAWMWYILPFAAVGTGGKAAINKVVYSVAQAREKVDVSTTLMIMRHGYWNCGFINAFLEKQ